MNLEDKLRAMTEALIDKTVQAVCREFRMMSLDDVRRFIAEYGDFNGDGEPAVAAADAAPRQKRRRMSDTQTAVLRKRVIAAVTLLETRTGAGATSAEIRAMFVGEDLPRDLYMSAIYPLVQGGKLTSNGNHGKSTRFRIAGAADDANGAAPHDPPLLLGAGPSPPPRRPARHDDDREFD